MKTADSADDSTFLFSGQFLKTMIVADWSQIGLSWSRAGVIAAPKGSQQPFENGNHLIALPRKRGAAHDLLVARGFCQAN
jgi:hypothetical protein